MAIDFHTTKVITSNLQNWCSDEDLSTARWCFFSSFIVFLILSVYSLTQGEKITKEGVDKFCLVCHIKQSLAHVKYLVMRPPLILTDLVKYRHPINHMMLIKCYSALDYHKMLR